MRVAAIDIGTNSVLLVVAEQTPQGPQPVLERASITRLGRGVDRTKRLSEEGRSRTLRCLQQYAQQAQRSGAQRVAVVGTSVLRDAQDAERFLREVERVVGVAPRVIDGREEAHLTFRGALTALDVTGAVVVFDVGGGSTEVISGVVSGQQPKLTEWTSLDIGSVRLFERHLQSDPPTAPEIERLRADVRHGLQSAQRGREGCSLVGVAGTVTTLAAIEQQLVTYDCALVHGARLSASEVEALARRLSTLPLTLRRQLPGLEPARADVIVAGAWITREVLAWAGASELIVSDRGVRWGLVQSMLG